MYALVLKDAAKEEILEAMDKLREEYRQFEEAAQQLEDEAENLQRRNRKAPPRFTGTKHRRSFSTVHSKNKTKLAELRSSRAPEQAAITGRSLSARARYGTSNSCASIL